MRAQGLQFSDANDLCEISVALPLVGACPVGGAEYR